MKIPSEGICQAADALALYVAQRAIDRGASWSDKDTKQIAYHILALLCGLAESTHAQEKARAVAQSD